VVLVTAGFAGLASRGRRLELTREKNQVKWLLWGFMVGVAPYVFLRTLPALLGLDPPLPPLFDRVFELAIPLAFVSAVVLFRLFDIDLLIRRSLIYGLLAAAFVLFNVVLGFAAARWILPVWPDGVWPLLTAMGLIAGVSFRPLRNRIGLWVDRVFFKIRHDHDLALARFRSRIEEAPGCTELAGLLVPFLRERLGAARTAVVLHQDGEPVSAGDVEPSRAPLLLAGIERRLQSALLPLAAPDVTGLPELELSTFPRALTREGFVLVQPFPSGPPLRGAVLLGPKETEWRYVDPDLRFLADLARIAGDALDRIALVRRVAEESIERRRLDELNRMKSDFLYQVAHDLRTPLADIGWRFQNLLDGVVGELEDPQEEYLKTAQTSAAHLTRMVENLLDVSRLERTVAAPAPEPVVLEEVISEAAASLQHLLEQKNVSLRIESRDGPTTVQAHRGKLFEVAMNLLDNAAKYTAPGTEIEAEVTIPSDGQPRFRVRDRGPGIDPAALDGLFTPFRQGKESPYSSRVGFGLGLYISRAYMELFGGTLEARNHPEGGAMFIGTFPPRSPERSTP
jgi:signal transduction histidine kinase